MATETQIQSFIELQQEGDLNGVKKTVYNAFKRYGPHAAYQLYEKMRKEGDIGRVTRFSTVQGCISELKNDHRMIEVVDTTQDPDTGREVEVYDIREVLQQ